MGAACCVWMLVSFESASKSAPDRRPPLEKAAMGFGPVMKELSRLFTLETVSTLIAKLVGMCQLAADGISLWCGATYSAFMMVLSHSGAADAAEAAGLFRSVEALQRRVCPTPLPADYWIDTCDVVDIRSVQLTCLWQSVISARSESLCVDSNGGNQDEFLPRFVGGNAHLPILESQAC